MASAWEYYQSAGLNARPYLATVAANTSAIDPNGAVLRNVFNEYGFNIGGPVYIPKLVTGKKKLFFFDNWERTTRHQLIGNGVTLTVPDTNMINGNFSEAAPYATIYDPQPTADVGQCIDSHRQLPDTDLHRRLSQLCMPPELHLRIWRDGQRTSTQFLQAACHRPSAPMVMIANLASIAASIGTPTSTHAQQLHGQRLHRLGPLCLRPHQ